MKKKVIIPVFVPHMGCPFDCIFCNQKSISGQQERLDAPRVKRLIDEYLDDKKENGPAEIAFYGGSFTGIPLKLQEELLETGNEYIRKGLVGSIRVSTRPDMIDESVLEKLKNYGVELIEIGAQSLDNEVLKLSGRGHTAEDTYRAARLIKEANIKLGIQTMIGLPGDTAEKALDTARKAADMDPETVRIYPALVIRGTALEKMTERGEYTPLSVEEAADICARLLEIYYEKNINVIRVGLQASESVDFSGDVIAGPFHPSFRHIAETQLMRRRIEKILSAMPVKGTGTLVIEAAPGNISNTIGYKKQNATYLKDLFGFKDIKAISNKALKGYEVVIVEQE